MSTSRTRLGALALGLAAALFILYPAVRPWKDESTVEGATAALGSGAWIASHLFAMIGFILVPLGLLAVTSTLNRTRAEPLALASAVIYWIGAGLVLPYYGAEDFGLYAIARKTTEGKVTDILELAEAFRFNPVAATMFGIGLLSMALGAILTAIAIWRSQVLPRYSGIPFAAGFALFLPQFFTPPAARIAHGLLVAVGLTWMALTLWNTTTAEE